MHNGNQINLEMGKINVNETLLFIISAAIFFASHMICYGIGVYDVVNKYRMIRCFVSFLSIAHHNTMK